MKYEVISGSLYIQVTGNNNDFFLLMGLNKKKVTEGSGADTADCYVALDHGAAPGFPGAAHSAHTPFPLSGPVFFFDNLRAFATSESTAGET